LEVTVIDDGAGPMWTTAGWDGATRDPGGSGHGLVGMRERVSLFGGELRAGPGPDGGFAVTARFPLPSGQG
jgi:signal transduction histidine kinase